MPIFRRSSSQGSNTIINGPPVPITRSREQPVKPNSDIHDPILTAIRDAQPFEESTRRPTATTVSPEFQFRDMFGTVISQPDRSNPTRQRNERPLDTIRTFEYACTGDERIREDMETPRLGWSTRRTFTPSTNVMPSFASNPYATSANNVASFDGDNGNGYSANYMRPQEQSRPPPEPKKKRGFFRRK